MKRLSNFRKSKNMTQRQMADRMNITLSMYEKVERGAVPASAAFMRRLKKIFPEINVDYIFFGKE